MPIHHASSAAYRASVVCACTLAALSTCDASAAPPRPHAAQDPQRVAAARGWRETALFGRILTTAHDGVPAAVVTATNEHGHTVARTVADGMGHYELRRLPRGALLVHARAEGMANGWLPVEAAGSVREATLLLEPGTARRGTVTLADGTPAKNVHLLFRAATYREVVRGNRVVPLHWNAAATTAEDGSWSLPAVPQRDLTVLAHVPGLHLHHQEIAAHDAEPTIVVPHAPARPRTVHVTGLDAGVEARVQIHPRGGGRPERCFPRSLRDLPLDADHTVQLDSLPLVHEVRVVAPGFRSMPVFVTCQAGEAHRLDFEMAPVPAELRAPTTTVTGRVVDEFGAPVGGIVVAATCGDRRSEAVATGSDGRFALLAPARAGVLCSFAVLSPSRHLVSPRRHVDRDGLTWLDAPATPDRELQLHVSAAGAVRGVLRLAAGQPFGAARVELTGADGVKVVTATDSGGRLEVVGLPPGAYRLRASRIATGDGTTSVEVLPGEATAPGELQFADATTKGPG